MNPQPIAEADLAAEGLESQATEIHILDVLILLLRRRRFIFLCTAGAAILAAIVVFIIPSQYTAGTLILPPAQNSSVSSSLLSQLDGANALASIAGAGLGIKNPAEMYVSLFRSRTVEDAMIQHFGLMARYREKRITDARTAFENHTTVVLGVKDGLIRITVRDRDPGLAAEMANAYVDEFRKLTANLAITEASQRRAFFQQQLLEANGNLTTAEEAMKHTEQSTGVLQIDSQSRALIESAATLRAQISAKEVQLQSMSSFATENNPDVIQAKQQLSALQNQLVKLSGSKDASSSDIILTKGSIPAAGMEYLRKLRDLKYYETISGLIAKQFELAKLDEAREGATIQVADRAVTPDKRSFPKRTLTVILVTILSFFASAGWCVIASQYEQMRNTPADRQRLDALRAALRHF